MANDFYKITPIQRPAREVPLSTPKPLISVPREKLIQESLRTTKAAKDRELINSQAVASKLGTK